MRANGTCFFMYIVSAKYSLLSVASSISTNIIVAQFAAAKSRRLLRVYAKCYHCLLNNLHHDEALVCTGLNPGIPKTAWLSFIDIDALITAMFSSSVTQA